jgi:hypothetical protein
MNTWIVGMVGFSQIAVLYLLALPYGVRMTYHVYLGKNRQWVQDNAAFREHYPEPKYTVWFSYVVGAGLFAYFLYRLSIDSDASWQVDLLTLSVLPFSAIYICHAIVECFRVRAKIPLATKRSVVLERRSLDSMVGPRWVYGGYLLLAIAIAAHCFAFYDGRVEARVFAKHIVGAVGITSLMTIGLIYCIRRKKQSIDEMWGPSYRRSEVIFIIALLYLFAFGSLIVALQYVFVVQWLSRIDAAVAVSVIIQAGMFYLGRHAWPKNSITPNRPPAIVG